MSEPKILFIGPGAIGGSVAAWVAENYPATFVMGHGATLAALRKNGLTTYRFDAPDATRRTVRPAMVDRPAAVADEPGCHRRLRLRGRSVLGQPRRWRPNHRPAQ